MEHAADRAKGRGYGWVKLDNDRLALEGKYFLSASSSAQRMRKLDKESQQNARMTVKECSVEPPTF